MLSSLSFVKLDLVDPYFFEICRALSQVIILDRIF